MRLTLLFLGLTLVACNQPRDPTRSPGGSAADEAFAGVQTRGAAAMGVNQYTSRHVFESLPDGGRIQLEREVMDSAGADQISRHMRHIAERFASGDFALPGFVHARAVPGFTLMLIAFAGAASVVGVTSRATPSEISFGPHFKTAAKTSRLASAAPPYIMSRERRMTFPTSTRAEALFAS